MAQAHDRDVDTIGLRLFRRQAAELVRRAQNGQSITITVRGQPAARLVPAKPDTWRTFDEIAELFSDRPGLQD